MGLSDALFGTSGEIRAMPTMSPQQSRLFRTLLNRLGGQGGMMNEGLDQLQGQLSGSPESLQAFQAPMMRQFNEQIVPGLAERFTSQFGPGAQNSSAFGQQLAGAGSRLQESLSTQKAGLQQQAMSQLFNLFQQGTGTPTFQYQQIPGTEGMFGPLMGGLGQGAGQAFGTSLMMKLLPMLL